MKVAEVSRTILQPYRLGPGRTKRNKGGHSDGKFRTNLGPCPLICALLHQFVRFLSQVLFPGNARTLAISTRFDELRLLKFPKRACWPRISRAVILGASLESI